jgi:hypothetical protein
MSGLLEALLGDDPKTIDRVRAHTGNDPKRAEQAYTAAAGTILRGLEAKSQTEEGAASIWDLLRKQVEKGSVPSDAPSRGGVNVRDMEPQEVTDFMKVLFGKDAPQVQGGFGRVITLDPEASRKVFEKVLPAVLGGIFGAAERDPAANRRRCAPRNGRAATEVGWHLRRHSRPGS